MRLRGVLSRTGAMQRVPSPVQCRDTQRRTGCEATREPSRVSPVEPAGPPKGIDAAETARKRWTGEPVRADADGDGAGRRQHRRECMATPDHRGLNPMMFAHLKPIQAKAEGTFAGSTQAIQRRAGVRSNPVRRLVSARVEPATERLGGGRSEWRQHDGTRREDQAGS